MLRFVSLVWRRLFAIEYSYPPPIAVTAVTVLLFYRRMYDLLPWSEIVVGAGLTVLVSAPLQLFLSLQMRPDDPPKH